MRLQTKSIGRTRRRPGRVHVQPVLLLCRLPSDVWNGDNRRSEGNLSIPSQWGCRPGRAGGRMHTSAEGKTRETRKHGGGMNKPEQQVKIIYYVFQILRRQTGANSYFTAFSFLFPSPFLFQLYPNLDTSSCLIVTHMDLQSLIWTRLSLSLIWSCAFPSVYKLLS